MAFLPRGNNVLEINPPVGVDEFISVHGSDFLWAVTAIYIVSFFPPSPLTKANEYSTTSLLVGAITYFAQAADLGWSAAETTNNLTRQIFYTRYINWVMSFPSLVLALGLLSGISWTTIVLNIFIAWFWILSYLASAYTSTSYKWGFFAFGTFAYIILVASTLNESRESAEVIGISRDYMILACWTNLLWLIYPIAFGLTDGAGVVGVTGSAIFFGVLDVLLLPVVSVGFLVLSRNWDFKELQLDFSEYRGVRHGGHVQVEEELPVTGEAAAKGL